ncbi:MAG: tetratricopeptide repeat protein [Gaiellaceae bacterium]
MAGDPVEDARRLVDARPDDGEAWHELGAALLEFDRLGEAADAFARAAELRPQEAAPLIDLAHSRFATGQLDLALLTIQEAVAREPRNASALFSTVELSRMAGRPEEALTAARQIVEAQPDDVSAILDVAELSLELGKLDDASSAFASLRGVEEDPEHEIYAFHGLIEVELRREEWRRALDLAVEAARADRYGRTTDLLAFATAQVFGARDRPAPSRDEVDAALAASRAEHRRLHAEQLAI